MRKQIIRVLIEFKKILQEKLHQYNEQLPFMIAIFVALILVVGGINLFIDLTEILQSKTISRFDQTVTDFIISFRSPQLNKIFQFITDLGDVYGYLILTALCAIGFYLRFKIWRYVLEMLFVMIIAGLSNLALKQVINRARPDAAHLVAVETLSYPSGHAMGAIAFYGFLIYLFYNFKMNTWLKTGILLIFSFLILAIGISRVYLGVHYPSDIVGGFIAGFIWIIFCVILFQVMDIFRKRKRSRQELNE
ncbi:phosphatase PAP2 family protein [Gillisia limnaea]|uniref:Phosphoesterase PA-phosphatase related protein n=1 Tax=Gillisia limnaea (strain DSM 15749 / LMG 21470 / R-8282) TaxID=865937 RepID=H2BQS7_GILLR|nr:phosphatase PAP2 family protein [Gillisia limnaea]EHQ04246.1 phosphoesterase PA-phosphatase related protein [Gillisia limnaea DSM 15749]